MSAFRLILAVVALSLTPLASRRAEAGRDGRGVLREEGPPRARGALLKCHFAAANKTKGGLALDTRAGLIEGGETGPAIVPGQPAKGTLLNALRHDGAIKMHNEQKKLPDAVIADFEACVKMGTPDPRGGKSAKKGIYYSETDEIGQTITKNPVHIHDLHATMLHLMGLDPEKLTFKYGGRDQRLTDVSGKVVHGVIA